MTQRKLAIIAGSIGALSLVTLLALGYADAFTDAEPWESRLDELAIIQFALTWVAGSVAFVCSIGASGC